MAHPNKKDASESNNAKMRRMTAHYGSANPSMMKLAPVDADKEEGEEDVPSFGADSSAAKPRGDRPARRTAAANPLSTYRKGGRVKAKKRADGGDVDTIEEANRDQAMSNPQARARGGRMKHKGSTHVNVIVAPQGGAGAPGGPMGAAGMPPPVIAPPGAVPPGMGAGPPPAMPPKPPMMPPGAGGPMAMPPGMPPPGMMPPRAKGGRVKHADEKEDRALFKKMFKESEKKEGKTERARGGKITSIHDMDAGAASGEGRLQKADLQKHAGRMKSQAV